MSDDMRPSTAHPDTAGIPPATRVCVVGCGTMGAGIVQVAAAAGVDVQVVERDAPTLDRGLSGIRAQLQRAADKGAEMDVDAVMNRISPAAQLAEVGDVQLVIEAVPERLDIKQSLFAELDTCLDPSVVLATNTSALSVTRIAAAATRAPKRVTGLHFFNPVPVLPLVEVIRAEQTSDDALARAYAFTKQIGKHPIVCRDTPGFVVNRILIPVLNDVVSLWDQGLASAQDIDDGCRYGLNWPIGPLALCDLVGIDVAVHAAEALYAATREPRMAPPAALVRLADAGHLGRKTGRGFYDYT